MGPVCPVGLPRCARADRCRPAVVSPGVGAVGLCRGFRKLEKLLTRVKRGEAHRRGCGFLGFLPRTILLKRSTSLAEPMHKGVRWSTVLIFTSSTEPPDTPSEVLPPAISTRRPNGDASKARRSLAGDSFAGGVGEDTHILCELLVDVRDETPSVTQGVAFVLVEAQELLVALDLVTRAHVRGREDARVGLDLDLLAGADPGSEAAVGLLAAVGGTAVGELVHAVIETDEHGGTGPVQGDERCDLVAARGANQPVRAGTGFL